MSLDVFVLAVNMCWTLLLVLCCVVNVLNDTNKHELNVLE